FYTKSAYNGHHRTHMASLGRTPASPASSPAASCPSTPPLCGLARGLSADATLPIRFCRSATLESEPDDCFPASPATPPLGRAEGLPLGVLPPLHEYLGVLSKAACDQAPLPLPLPLPQARQLGERSTLAWSPAVRYAPY
ncbi:hypothetical protein IWQ57_006394, partial [Coemansia nantahalensis]